MQGILWMVGAGTVVLVALVSYIMTRRYGWGLAVAVPMLALAAMLGMEWQAGAGPDLAGGLIFAAPVLLGTVAGIAVARFSRG